MFRLLALTVGALMIANPVFAEDKAHDHSHAPNVPVEAKKVADPKNPVVKTPEGEKPKAVAEELAPRPKTLEKITAELGKVQPTDVVIGKPDAAVTIIEYASFSCIHCAHFYNDVFPTIKEKYIDTGKVKLVFRNYPLNEPALRASQLVRCIDKDKKEGHIKTLFKTIEKWAFEKDFLEKLRSIAKIGGMTDKDFDACMKNKDVENSILAEQLIATKKLNIQSTPTFYVNGNLFENVPKDKFIEGLERAIAGKEPLKSDAKADAKAPAAPAAKSDEKSESKPAPAAPGSYVPTRILPLLRFMSDTNEKPSLEALKDKIDAAKAKESGADVEQSSAVASPTRISLELFSGVFVGTGMGYFLDKWLGTSPLFLIILFFLGAIAGGLNIYRIAKTPIDDEKKE
ncbi:MAG: hypothetical protein EB060_03475 [Proteobacteria bacterium]|nr:hypothetical protein [Pseudomonadota bacterium]